MGLRERKSLSKALLMWAVVALLLLIMATPALSTIFAAPGSVNTKAIVNGAVKAKKIANGAVTTRKIAKKAVTAAKINRTGLNADKLDGKDSGDFVAKTGDQTMAGKLTASSIGYSTPKTGYVSVVGSAVVPRNSASTYTKSGGRIWTSELGSIVYFEAPVSLPDGATITNFRYIAYDDHATLNSTAWLARKTSTTSSLIAQATTSANSTSWQTLDDNSVLLATVDNSQYAYYVMLLLYGSAGDALQAGMYIITYTYASPGS